MVEKGNISKILCQSLNEAIIPFSLEDSHSYKNVAEKIGDARLVLLGEATHGTREFYQARINLSQYLITEKNFHAIAIEGDWTSTYLIHNFVQGKGKVADAVAALDDFKRFPEWMWRNKTMLSFLKWLREYNDAMSETNKIGFYGLDLYCLSASMQAVIDYLKLHDPEAAKHAVYRYACFDHTAVDPQTYGYLTEAKLKKDCIQEVTEQLLEMQRIAYDKFHNEGFRESEGLFYASQNARVVKNAENYYRSMFESHETTWNIRDQHMAETLQNLISHLETNLDTPAKIIVWAHNSHVGDARATEMSERKEVNLGQLVRESFGTSSFHLGFSTNKGTVTAASEWGDPGENKRVVPGMPGSYEDLFHQLQYKDFILDLHKGEHVKHLLEISRLQRAIGVIYRPETERMSHYFFTHLPYQFDAVIHLDETTAVQPLTEATK